MTYNGLAQIAEYRVAHLNRQFIVILSALGIEDWVFKDLFTAAIEHIRGLPLRVASGQSSERDVKDADSLSSVGWLVKGSKINADLTCRHSFPYEPSSLPDFIAIL